MNQLPPLLALGPITLLIGITFLMQAIAIAFSSVAVKGYRGVRTFFLATLAMSAGFFVILIHPRGNFAVGLTSNLIIYTGNLLFFISICQFTEIPPYRWVTHALIPLGYIAFLANLFTRIQLPLITESINIPLSLASAYILFQPKNEPYKIGARLSAFALVLYALVSVWRLIIVVFSIPTPSGVPGADPLTALTVFVLSFLWTAGFILMISQRLQSHLNDLAMNDMLTRVRNRRAMHQLLEYELRRAERRIKDFSIILLDLDRFKRINDTYGHDTGDEALKWIADNLEKAARLEDTVSRWGGEEFLILLPATALDEAVRVAERMREYIELTPFKFKDVTINLTFSAGVSCSKEYPNVNTLCKIADQALYVAKRTRNRVVSQEQVEPIEEV